MAIVTAQPFYPLSCPLKQPSPSSSSSIPTKSQFSFSSLDPLCAAKSQRPVTVSVSFNPYGNLDLSLDGDEEQEAAPPPMPPTQGRFEIVIDNDAIARLDLTPFHEATGLATPLSHNKQPKEFLERTVGFTINYTREDERDPREFSEFPDIRLWFVRLDAEYPWLPVALDWRAGELARYAAMLVPHQMNMKKGVVFNPEALELFIVKKVFVVYSWLKENDIPMPRIKAKDMARMLGFGIGDELFDLVDKQQQRL